MRILHTADWHLGRTLHGVDLAPAHAAFLDHLVDTVRAERVDVVVIAGDVYDRAFPPLESVSLLQDALVRLCERAHVVLTPGNHDSAIRLGFGADLFRERLAVRARPLDAATPLVVPDADGGDGLLVYAVPYLDPDAARVTLAPWSAAPLHRSHEAALTAVVDRVRADLAARRATARIPAVLVAHAFVQGGLVCDSERDIRVGGVDAVPAAVFDGSGLDYVALGHLHGPQRVGPAEGPGPRLRYAGSPVAMSFSERGHTKSSALVELDASGVRSLELIDAPVRRRLSEVRGTLDEVLGRRHAAQREDWVRVVVTGRSRPHDLVSAVKRVFPHALEVQFVPEGAERPLLPGLARESADPLGVLEEFVTTVRRQAPDARERLVLREAYEAVRRAEAGV
nr:exonuclease SbcCD subunit D [Propionibacterium sp.]